MSTYPIGSKTWLKARMELKQYFRDYKPYPYGGRIMWKDFEKMFDLLAIDCPKRIVPTDNLDEVECSCPNEDCQHSQIIKLRKNRNDSAFKCEVCGKQFRVHHPDEDDWYKY